MENKEMLNKALDYVQKLYFEEAIPLSVCILEARKYYVNHSLEETYEKFGYNSLSKGGFRSSLTSKYDNIPIYKKVKKKWYLKDKEIDINNYNPVSTISESGE